MRVMTSGVLIKGNHEEKMLRWLNYETRRRVDPKFKNPIDTSKIPEERQAEWRTFDRVELVLEESEVSTDVLTDARTVVMKLTGKRKIDETPAALSDEMEAFCRDMLDRAGKITLWAEPAGLPLPAVFLEGREAFEKIRALTTPSHRVAEIHAQRARLEAY